MADRPSVKGSLIAGTIEKARKLLEEGRLSRPALEARLSPEELALFDAPTSLSSWYDLDFYQRVAELMHDLEGGNPHEYFRGQGFARAQKLIDSGLYQQMEYLGRSEVAGTLDPKSRFEAYGRDLRRLVTLSGSILNFSRWSVARDPDHDDRYRIEIRDAAAYPDFLAWGTEGFIDAMASSHGLAQLWRYERLAPDFIVFRMLRPV